MDEILKGKSVSDLRQIAEMMGVELPKRATKAQIIAILESPAQESAQAAKKIAEKTAGRVTEQEPEHTGAEEPQKEEEKPVEKQEKPSPKRGRKPKNEKKAAQKEENEQKIEKSEKDESADASETETKEEIQEDIKAEEIAAAEENQQPAEEEKAENAENEARKQKNDRQRDPNTKETEGILEVMPDGYGFLRVGNYIASSRDVFVPPTFIRKFALKTGDKIKGFSKPQKDVDKYNALSYILSINDDPLDAVFKRKAFETLTPIYPDEKYRLEKDPNEFSTRIIDIMAPIGKGQRGMIVSPPKAGKTVLLKTIANSISQNYPDAYLIVLLIDERPEEVTDMRESIKGEVISSTFDEIPERHVRVAEFVYERAQRLVEHGRDVVILLDSITRLARAYNLTVPPTGRSLSGGLDPGALHKPKKFFGAARNIRDGGSLTIIATALIDTGSKMDDVIFEEFKGTGNMELHLDRSLSERRIFPAIDIKKSGTRKEELLLTEKELNVEYAIRKKFSTIDNASATGMLIDWLQKKKTNEELIEAVKNT